MGWRLGSIEKQKLVISPEPRRFGVVPLRRRGGSSSRAERRKDAADDSRKPE
jgi:hypothetical protein